MTNMIGCDVLVIGAGSGGLAAAKAAREHGAGSVVVLERNAYAGGILRQCIHDGFGLIRYGKILTGPEYAYKAYHEALRSGAEVLLGRHVANITPNKVVTSYSKGGIEAYKAGAIVLATGCRERTRGAISIPGSRPAGIYTAGVAQRLINCQNILIGKRVVILGSGDIGMIMARRLKLEGISVVAVVEAMARPSGLARNVSQCLYDYGIPLYVNTTVTEIIGKKRVEAVRIASVDERMNPIQGTESVLECDTLVLSVGLIPENEVALTCGVRVNDDNSVVTDGFLQTSVRGVFSCGNSRHIMDLADYVSEQGETAGGNAAKYILGQPLDSWDESRTSCMKKGFPEDNTVTCTICPSGCQIGWNRVNDTFTGNRCPRGKLFARQEMTDPVRTVTTTVRIHNSDIETLVPVRSIKPVPKDEVINVVRSLNGICLDEMEDGDRIEVPLKCGGIAEMIADKEIKEC